MKTQILIIFSAIILFSFGNTQAQDFKIGAKIGANASKYYGGSFADGKFKFGGTYGFVANVRLYGEDDDNKGDLRLQPELLLTQKGVRNGMDWRLRTNYLELPVMAQYTFCDHDITGYAEFGPSLAFWTCGAYWNDGDRTDYPFDSDRDRRFDLGLNFGAGTAIDVGRGEFQLGLRYNLGMIDTQKDINYGFFTLMTTARNQSLSLHAAYLIGLDGKAQQPEKL